MVNIVKRSVKTAWNYQSQISTYTKLKRLHECNDRSNKHILEQISKTNFYYENSHKRFE